MEISRAIRERRSIRGFKQEPVPQVVLHDIIDTAQWAGSFLNMQPWEFAVLGGEVMTEWKKRLVKKFEAGESEEREYPVGTPPFPDPYGQRAESFRSNIDDLMFPPELENPKEAQHAYTISGIQVRDAPNAIVIYTDRKLFESPLHIMAIGIMAQTVCLAAMDHDLGTCIMGRPVEMPGILRELLDISRSRIIMCVIAIGYPDANARINSLKRERAPMESWVHWHGF